MRDGCLMIGEGVVFWPAGTSWDEAKHEVEFGGDFNGSPSARVGSTFDGGGGLFDVEGDMSGVLSTHAEIALRECLDLTGATRTLLAYPDWP